MSLPSPVTFGWVRSIWIPAEALAYPTMSSWLSAPPDSEGSRPPLSTIVAGPALDQVTLAVAIATVRSTPHLVATGTSVDGVNSSASAEHIVATEARK